MAKSSMRDIKRRIRSVKSIEHITNAMRLVSAAKFRRSKIVLEKTQGYLHYITDRIDEIFTNVEETPNRYLSGNHAADRIADRAAGQAAGKTEDRAAGTTSGRACYIVITSNRGLAGSYNSNVIKAAERAMQEGMSKGREKPLLVCIGSKGLSYFSKRGYEILSEHLNPPESISFVQASEIAAPAIELFEKEEIDEFVLVYTDFVSTIEQHARVERLLPFDSIDEVRENSGANETGVNETGTNETGASETGANESKTKETGASETGKNGTGTNVKAAGIKRQVEYEPGAGEVLGYLVSKYAEIMTWRAIVESAACEHAARRMAMQNATDNAREMIDNLELSFNRARQAAITREITEIVSGADAIKR